jgi:hypothetical protein
LPSGDPSAICFFGARLRSLTDSPNSN